MRFIVDAGGDERASLIVAGSGRSGTTWVAETLSSVLRAREMFEPCLLDRDLEFAVLRSRRLVEDNLRRNFQFYLPPDAGRTSPYHRALGEILHGRVHNRWCDGFTRSGFYRRRVIKVIRANLSLAYLARQWPRLKIIWIVRDPISVVRSQIRMSRDFNYTFDFDIGDIVNGRQLLADWLAEYAPFIRSAGIKAERLAHRWCIETMGPFWQRAHELENVLLVRYEDLVSRPAAWDEVFRFVSWPRSRALTEEVLDRPSRSTKVVARESGTPELTAAETAAVEKIVNSYGASRWLCARPSADARALVFAGA